MANLLLTPAEKYERIAFTFCKMGATGLMAWIVSPAVFVLIVASLAIVFYGRAVMLGITRSRCILRRPMLIMGFWSAVIVVDAALLWLSRR